METLQILLTISLILVALAAAAVLIYFIFVLKEIRESIEETKGIIENARKLTTTVVTPVASIMSLIGGISKGLNAIRSVTDIFDSGEEDEYYEEF
jgi:hypothetical protein